MFRHAAVGLILSGLLHIGTSPPVRAWTQNGVCVKETSAHIPQIAACADGAQGAVIFWQEEVSPDLGVIRAQHLLPNGDGDPAWPVEGVVVCGAVASRQALGAIPDRLGGGYAWWMENRQLYLTRIAPDGQVAPGWPARGTPLGSLPSDGSRPSVVSDGAHGVCIAWPHEDLLAADPHRAVVARFEPDGSGSGAFTRAADLTETFDLWPQVARAPDGGVFAAWALASYSNPSIPSGWMLSRFTADFEVAPGWPANGLMVASLEPTYLDPERVGALVALSEDGRGGVFMFVADPTSPPEYGNLAGNLRRLEGDGSPSPDWPAGGLSTYMWFSAAPWADHPDASVRVFSAGEGRAWVGMPSMGTDAPAGLELECLDASGLLGAGPAGDLLGVEVHPGGSGDLFVASFKPTGKTGWWDPEAYLGLVHAGAPVTWSWYDHHEEPSVRWYRDIGLAATDDGGAVFAWSQERERFGLFARRFTATTEVLDVPPVEPIRRLSARFSAGVGLQVRVAFAADGEARLEAFDPAGRRVAALRVPAAAGRSLDVALPGTSALASGLYFVRRSGAGSEAFARVVVTR